MGIYAAMPFGIGPMELIIVLVIVLVLFGPKRLPQLGKSLGKTVKAIREGVEGGEDKEGDEEVAAAKEAVQAKADEAESTSAKATEDSSDE